MTAESISFVLIGSVDHGKTSCAGRILVDTHTVSERDVEKAINDADANGMKSWWLAYLLDVGEERLTGKTYEYTIVPIEYNGVKANMIDVPGHRKFVKDMITGASHANIAVLICSAKKGEIESGLKGQTYEHLLLSRAVGIDTLIVAINKMDHESVQWNKDIYENAKQTVNKLISRLRFKNVSYIPISAIEGTNVVNCGNQMLSDGKICEISLMDTVISSKPRSNKPKVFENKSKIKAKCEFIGVENIVTIGYSCTLHSANQVTTCTIVKIDNPNKRPFITGLDKGFIDVLLTLDPPIDISTFVILRDGDRTLAIGRIVIKKD